LVPPALVRLSIAATIAGDRQVNVVVAPMTAGRLGSRSLGLGGLSGAHRSRMKYELEYEAAKTLQ
jgi:hypothetical protein